ncbi:hypothetical protein CPC197_0070 [Chlamydia psittaci C1/97]|nr:hypothetical protein CPC197_0070 [Chlamydia psittaci C1/97]
MPESKCKMQNIEFPDSMVLFLIDEPVQHFRKYSLTSRYYLL